MSGVRLQTSEHSTPDYSDLNAGQLIASWKRHDFGSILAGPSCDHVNLNS